MRLKDKIIIITGGANGIGRAFSKQLFQEGASILIADIDLDQGQALAEELNEQAVEQQAAALRVDVTSEEDTLAMAQRAVDEFGRIDVLINNAGTYPHEDFEDITYESWRSVITVNLDSVFLCSKAVLPQMKKQATGKIVNIATNLVFIGLPSMAHYVAAKSGIIGLTRSLAREVGEFNISVNALAPGALVRTGNYDVDSLQRLITIVDRQCLKWGQSEADLLGPITFLASSESDFVSGQILTVDGGLTNH